ncbi:hypothetical protein Pcinc_028293 [Petrolisthes cinctipes]|uniref:non-specific serine/threonine protein kinase n=1 Tax=Petrolisthes cinctipes TaxID=88211 RepID=A0AAE1K9J0_PETCI|nr:hypothetical protein Pcinc_028293 [Petrolisthes cinctipes]
MQAVESSERDPGITATSEIRFLPSWAKSQLAHILEVTHGWREVMGRVPGPPWTPGHPLPQDQHYPRKYSSDDITLVSEECNRDRREGFQVLMEEWGTSGRQRPTVADLLAILQLSKLYRAMDYLTVNVMKGEAVAREDNIDDTERQLDQALEEDCRFHNQFVYGQPDFGSVHFQPSPLSSGKVTTDNSTPSLGTQASIPSTAILDPYPVPQDSYHTLQDHPPQNYYHASQDHNHAHHVPITPMDIHSSHSNPSHILQDPHNLPIEPNNSSTPDSSQPQHLDTSVLEGLDASGFAHFPCTLMKEITNDFTGLHVDEGGNKLGEGAFGVVFLASVIVGGHPKRVAIKKLNAGEIKVEEQFKTEIEVLSRCVHVNLLRLVGYSCDGPAWCLLYDYMSNGNLQDRLDCKGGSAPLGWETRVRIGEGSARGIAYLHTMQDRPLVHRDIKSANILLDHDLTPKVGDFGLVRLGGSGTHTRTLIKTTTVFGTSAYMAPEAFRGDISVKMDTFSFGIVLLELLTGLPSFDQDREGCDLLSYVQESEATVDQLLDGQAGTWDYSVAKQLFALAELCTQAKKNRPTMVQLLTQYPNL